MTPPVSTLSVVRRAPTTDDASSGPIGHDDGCRRCDWCGFGIEEKARGDSRFCGRKCRQAAFRLRRRSSTDDASSVDRGTTRPLRFAYADPPYPGTAAKYYRHEPTYKGEVDHVALIASLAADYDGWALSTSAKALRDLLPLCPPEARVCAWVKPHNVPPATYGLHNVWEPLIVLQGRRLRPGRRDGLTAAVARGGGDLMGRKPIAFCSWLFNCLGILPGDELVDLFPGTGIVSAAWRELSSGARGAPAGDASSADPRTTDRGVA